MLDSRLLLNTFLISGSLFFIGMVILFVCVFVSIARETKNGPKHIPYDYNYPY